MFRAQKSARLAAATACCALLVSACSSGTGATSSSGGKQGNLLVSYFSNGYYSGVVATQPSLQAKIPGKVKFLEVQSGPATLAGMKSGSYNLTTQTGNPPVLGAIALNTNLSVIWVEAYDNAALVVQKSIKSPADLVGKSLGYLEGSSEDFSFQSWLKLNHLAGKVTLVNLDRQAMVAAFKTGKIAGGYNDAPFTSSMIASGGRQVVDSTQIAKMGFPALNMVTVDQSFAKANPKLVLGYLCADAGAYQLMTGPNKKQAITKASDFLGQTRALGVPTGLSYPLIAPKDELTSKGLGAPGNVKNGAVVQSLVKTGTFLKSQGIINKVPTVADITAHVDTSFAQKVANGACSK
ncbi:ABC transporter substrate-binding protein [Leekyejoonella antrihumi]|uniref:ABC transporter substrate-binding protein n=1 Tax=Leekyejoonella antrihumi TaxID=1660198 RepID=A0A563DW52_9MICO|nr:ABC transporter substrate-binding protein [Leekyejoonella antrihumi]TWP34447.1 hypothetical protein FGL98_17165 [Leekyejoonella antrihumi]